MTKLACLVADIHPEVGCYEFMRTKIYNVVSIRWTVWCSSRCVDSDLDVSAKKRSVEFFKNLFLSLAVPDGQDFQKK